MTNRILGHNGKTEDAPHHSDVVDGSFARWARSGNPGIRAAALAEAASDIELRGRLHPARATSRELAASGLVLRLLADAEGGAIWPDGDQISALLGRYCTDRHHDRGATLTELASRAEPEFGPAAAAAVTDLADVLHHSIETLETTS